VVLRSLQRALVDWFGLCEQGANDMLLIQID